MKKTLFFCFIFCSITCSDQTQKKLIKSNKHTQDHYVSALIEMQTLPTVPLAMSEDESKQHQQTIDLCISTCQQSKLGKCLKEAGPCCCILCCSSIAVGLCIPTLPFAVIECLKFLGLTTL